MKNKLLSLMLAAALAAGCCGALAACGNGNDGNKPNTDNSGWEDLEGWEDDDNYVPITPADPDIPNWSYSGETIWIGAEESYYDGGDFEDYVEEGHNNRPILTNVNGATISFIVDVENDIDAWLFVTLAVNTGYNAVAASDKFSLKINNQNYDLTPEGDIRWLWQQADWWTNANYITVNFGQVNLKAGENRFDLSVHSEEVQLDCFIIQPND